MNMKKIIIALFMGLVLNLGNPAYGQGVTAIEAQRSARQSLINQRDGTTTRSSSVPSRTPAPSSTSTSGATDTRSSVEAQRDARQSLIDGRNAERAATNPSAPTTSGDVSSAAPLRSSSPASPEAQQRMDDQRVAEIHRQAAEQGEIQPDPYAAGTSTANARRLTEEELRGEPVTPEEEWAERAREESEEPTDEELYEQSDLTEEELAEDRRLTEEAEAEEEEEEEEEEAPAEEQPAANSGGGGGGVCDQIGTFNQAFSQEDSNEKQGFLETTANIIASLTKVMDALNVETATIMDSFQKYSVQKAAFDDAMNQLAIARNRQIAGTDAQTNKRPPDNEDRACAKATNAKNWTKTRTIKKEIAKAHQDGYLLKMNKRENTLQAADKTAEKNILWFSENTPESPDAAAEENPLLNADINAGSVFGHATYPQLESYDKMPDASAEHPATAIAAGVFATNIVGNKGIPKVSEGSLLSSATGELERTKQFRTAARKNLAYAPFADAIAKRTSRPNSKTGTWLRSFYSWLGTIGSSYSAEMAQGLKDDISEYEYQDHMYSKMYMNPDWVISLDTTDKQLRLEQLEIVNKNMSLEWDTFLALEKLATIDGVNLATTIDNSSEK